MAIKNLSRKELIKNLDEAMTTLQDVVDNGELNLADLASALEDDEYNKSPRRRYEVKGDLRKLCTTLFTVNTSLSAAANAYGRLKNGQPAPAPQAASRVEAAPRTVEEKVFKLSPRIRAREYRFPNGDVISVPRPVKLTVKASGNRELVTASGQRFVIHAGYEKYTDIR